MPGLIKVPRDANHQFRLIEAIRVPCCSNEEGECRRVSMTPDVWRIHNHTVLKLTQPVVIIKIDVLGFT